MSCLCLSEAKGMVKNMTQLITEERLESFLDLIKLQHNENQFQRIPIEVESELLNKIKEGKYAEIRISDFSKMDANLGVMAPDRKTGYTYLTVTAIALFSRTAIDCGVSPDDTFDLSDALLYALSKCSTIEEIHNIFQLSATMFAKRVFRMQNFRHSCQVEQTCNYISRNIYKKISIDELAAYAELSCTYLSHLFSKEMGISIHNYIQREKVNVACNLLKHTKRPISEISTYLGFQTQSNFGAIFKKWQNMTPTEYRNKNYREVY